MAAVAEHTPVAVTSRRRRQRTRRTRRQSPVVEWLEYAALRSVMAVLGVLPLTLAVRLGALFGTLGYWLDAPHRRIGMRNLAIAFPTKPLAERRRILRRSFQNLG